ncbi:MAG: hypothetical protein ACRDRZ_18545 [Pseudonocardiaceae bacterium]
MSQEHENARPTDDLPDQGEDARSALRRGWSRSGWSEAAHTKVDVRECSDASCMNVEVNVGYQGMVDDSALSQVAGVGNDLRSAWKTKLEGEGKRGSGGRSVKDLVFGDSSEPKQ